MRISKKILACVLAALMAIAMMPFTAFAEGSVVEVSTSAALRTAIAGATSGSTIKFTDDINFADSDLEIMINNDLIIDLNGHTLTGKANASRDNDPDYTEAQVRNVPLTVFAVRNGAKVEFKDSVGGGSFTYGTLKVSNNSTRPSFVHVRGNSEVTFTSGTYNYVGSSADVGCYLISTADTSKVTFNDGTFTATGAGSNQQNRLIYSAGTSNLVFNGGSFSVSKSADYVLYATGTGSGSHLEINDGTFYGKISGFLKIDFNGGTYKTYDGNVYTIATKYLHGVAQLEDGSIATLPTAAVTDITESTEYDMAKQFAANNDGTAFNDYNADFIVTVDKAVSTADVKLFGKIGSGNWIQFPEMTAEAGVEYYLARDAFEWEPTYADICNNVGTFSCAVDGEADEATTLTVKLVIYKEGVAPIVIESFTYDIPEKEYKDTMSITVEDDIDLNINVDTSDAEAEKVVYTFADPDSEDENATKSVTVNAGDEATSFTVSLAPAQIRDEIVATVYDENDQVIRTVPTSVADYCNEIIGMSDAKLGPKAAELRDLAKATLDYGKAASNYFEYNESAYSTYETQLADPTTAINNAVEAALLENGTNWYSTGTFRISGITYVAKSKPELRFYLQKDPSRSDADFENYLADLNDGLSCNIGTAKFVRLENTDEYMLQIKDIDIVDFGKQIVARVNGIDVLEFTALSWVKSAIANTNLGDLGKAIGNYYLKAVGYFGENN